ncbi:MAG: hypothetical protein ABFS34_05240 [Gemmatimonadota bacterium]
MTRERAPGIGVPGAPSLTPPRGPLARALSWLLVAATLGFVGWAFVQGWPRVAEHDWRLRPLLLLASTLLVTAVIVSAALVWGRVLRGFGADPVPSPALVRIWFHSNLARYVPGKIWQFVAAADLARARGLSPALMLISLIAFMGFVLLGAAVVAAAALPLPGVPAALTGALAAALAVALSHPAVVSTGVRLIPRRPADLRWRASWSTGVAILALCVIYWIVFGAAFVLFLEGVVGAPESAWVALVGANAAAYLVGYVVIVAPAGLGFREATLTALLGGILGSGLGDERALALGAVVALASRLWIVVAELLGATGSLAIDRPRSS